MDQSILPLHLRQGAIRSKEEAFEHQREHRQKMGILGEEVEIEEQVEEVSEWRDTRTKFQISMAQFLGDEVGPQKEDIAMNNWQFAIRIYPCAAWSVVVMCLMVLFLARYYTAVEVDGQRLLVLKLMLQTEVKIAASLAPAFRAVSSLALAARAGVLNTSNPYTSLSNILAPEFNAGPGINYVQVVGAGDLATLLRPGTIHVETMPTAGRHLLVFAASAPCASMKQNPMLCLSLNNSALINVPRDAAAMRWQRPSFLTYDGSMPVWVNADQRLDDTLDAAITSDEVHTFAHRLVAYINASNATSDSGGKGPTLAVEVAMDLAGTFSAIRNAAPNGGATYVCTRDGTVIAGSNWVPQATAMYDPEEGMVIYPRLWDLGFAWMDAITPDMVAGSRQAEGWSGSDIVVARPLAVGDQAGGSYRTGLADLRIVSTAPRTVGTSADFKALVHGAMGVMGAPGVFLLLALVTLAVYIALKACAKRLYRHWH